MAAVSAPTSLDTSTKESIRVFLDCHKAYKSTSLNNNEIQKARESIEKWINVKVINTIEEAQALGHAIGVKMAEMAEDNEIGLGSVVESLEEHLEQLDLEQQIQDRIAENRDGSDEEEDEEDDEEDEYLRDLRHNQELLCTVYSTVKGFRCSQS
ncbi:hypothetical protein EG329_006061 [Mollisiaceae sp. DMI_Dod_QoI]|nr:hypothetical protein EG329_006061 [Helotiales sp. DMI_Dod_QoI]